MGVDCPSRVQEQSLWWGVRDEAPVPESWILLTTRQSFLSASLLWLCEKVSQPGILTDSGVGCIFPYIHPQNTLMEVEYQNNIERNRRAGWRARGTEASKWRDRETKKKRLIVSRFGRDVACNNDRRLRPNEPIRKRNQAMNQRRCAPPDGPRTTCFIQYRPAAPASDATADVYQEIQRLSTRYEVSSCGRLLPERTDLCFVVCFFSSAICLSVCVSVC